MTDVQTDTEPRTPEAENERVRLVIAMQAALTRLTMDLLDDIHASISDPPTQTGDDYLRGMLQRTQRAHSAVVALHRWVRG